LEKQKKKIEQSQNYEFFTTKKKHVNRKSTTGLEESKK